MPRKAAELGPLAVSRIAEPGMHAVGGVSGLYLQVLATGGRSWVLRVVVGGRRRDMGLGGFPDVPLADARRRARDARETVEQGRDPIELRRGAKAKLRAQAEATLTFRQAALDYIAAHEASWKNAKHRQQWKNTLRSYAFPTLGDLSVQDIETPHVLAVLRPIWGQRTETAARLRGRIEQVLDAARAAGAIKAPWENPARWRGHLDKLLAARGRIARPEHHKALHYREAPRFFSRLQSAEGTGARALEFAILTATRSGEARGARWSEIELVEKVWTIPAARMKANKEHRVPLSPAVLGLLDGLPKFSGEDLVFPAPRGGPLSDMTLGAVLRRMGMEVTTHGFRSTFRDWAAEQTNYPREVAEMALAHAIGDKVEAAYRRGDLFKKRRLLMTAWSAFLGSL